MILRLLVATEGICHPSISPPPSTHLCLMVGCLLPVSWGTSAFSAPHADPLSKAPGCNSEEPTSPPLPASHHRACPKVFRFPEQQEGPVGEHRCRGKGLLPATSPLLVQNITCFLLLDCFHSLFFIGFLFFFCLNLPSTGSLLQMPTTVKAEPGARKELQLALPRGW